MDKKLWHKPIQNTRTDALREGQAFTPAEIERLVEYLDERVMNLARGHTPNSHVSPQNEMIAGVLGVLRHAIAERSLYQPLVWRDFLSLESLASPQQRDLMNDCYSTYFAERIKLSEALKEPYQQERLNEAYATCDRIIRKRLFFEIDNALAAAIGKEKAPGHAR